MTGYWMGKKVMVGEKARNEKASVQGFIGFRYGNEVYILSYLILSNLNLISGTST
jgi:hypothetical protein